MRPHAGPACPSLAGLWRPFHAFQVIKAKVSCCSSFMSSENRYMQLPTKANSFIAIHGAVSDALLQQKALVLRQAQTYGSECNECSGLRSTQMFLFSAGGAASAAFSPDMILKARRGFQTQLFQPCHKLPPALTPPQQPLSQQGAVACIGCEQRPCKGFAGGGQWPFCCCGSAGLAVPTWRSPNKGTSHSFVHWMHQHMASAKASYCELGQLRKLLLLLCCSQIICIPGILQVYLGCQTLCVHS